MDHQTEATKPHHIQRRKTNAREKKNSNINQFTRWHAKSFNRLDAKKGGGTKDETTGTKMKLKSEQQQKKKEEKNNKKRSQNLLAERQKDN